MNKVRILWSGITGRTGKQALIESQNCECATVVAGVCRNSDRYYNYDMLDNIIEEFDVIVDFSHKDSFDKILEFALKVKKPLIIGTAKLTDEQIKKVEEAALYIPIFRGGNFRFDVKQFIDEVVEYAKDYDGEIKVIETFYKTKTIPSETSKVIAKKVLDETGKEIKIESHLEYDDIICDWRVENLHCRTCGFEQLARDVLKIASMMVDRSPDGVYDLDKLIMEEKKYRK